MASKKGLPRKLAAHPLRPDPGFGVLSGLFWALQQELILAMTTQTAAPLISLRDYLRPWKLFTLACGVSILVFGAYRAGALDWDVPLSFLMALFTYIFAPISSRALVRRRWVWLPLALAGAWWSVDGVYWAYWSWKNPFVAASMRTANIPTSACLYCICACLWLHDGPLREAFPGKARNRSGQDDDATR